jgi:hypothetical protein
VPPPAIEFITPAAKAAVNINAEWNNDMCEQSKVPAVNSSRVESSSS